MEEISQLILIGFNLVNSRVDAYRILKNKTIAHGVNFSAYLIVVLVLAYYSSPFLIPAALFNRQITFDIPLNLRRGLTWDYVSLDRPPKAWFDRLEIRIFGYNGRLMVLVYSILWVVFSLLIYA